MYDAASDPVTVTNMHRRTAKELNNSTIIRTKMYISKRHTKNVEMFMASTFSF